MQIPREIIDCALMITRSIVVVDSLIRDTEIIVTLAKAIFLTRNVF